VSVTAHNIIDNTYLSLFLKDKNERSFCHRWIDLSRPAEGGGGSLLLYRLEATEESPGL
jgi:hypothetical protein